MLYDSSLNNLKHPAFESIRLVPKKQNSNNYRATIPPFLKTLMLTVTPFSQEETTLSSENDA